MPDGFVEHSMLVHQSTLFSTWTTPFFILLLLSMNPAFRKLNCCLGRNGGLNVIVRSYEPNIMCLGRFPPPFPGTCSTLIDNVAISTNYLAFVKEPVHQSFVIVPPNGLIIKDRMYILLDPIYRLPCFKSHA